MHGGHALAVTRQADRDLIHCHSGCKPEAVLSKLGMAFADLEHGGEPQPGPVPEWAQQPYVKPGKPRPYAYKDEGGELLYTVFRHEPKAFKQQAADGSWTIKDVRRVLYRLPAVLAAVAEGRTIHLAEGEKAADALHASGVMSTCNSGGSAGWRDELADPLKGAAEVIVWQDRDDAGAKWAAAVTESLKARGVPHRVVQSRTEAPADDAWDHLAAGWSTEQAVPVERVADAVERLLSELLDSSGLDGIPSPEPLISGWLTLDTLCRINGEPGAGKSFTALDWAGHVGTGARWNGHAVTQGPVVYLVAEGARGFKKRVRAWEQHHRRRMANVYFLPRPVQVMGDEWGTFRELCTRVRPVLIVVDTQSRVTVGVEENSNTDMGRVVERMEALRADTGACVLLAHHTPKGGEGGRGAGAITGAINTEFMASKKRNGSTVVTLENTKEKDEAEGSKLRFAMQVIELDPQPGADPFETETSVVLVPEERAEAPAAEVDLSLPEGLSAKEKLRTLLVRVWGNGGVFTKAEAQGLAVRDTRAVARPTFHAKWKELVGEGFIRAELSESGRELSRFRVDTTSDG
ncbi:AAA family ATPase [Streptomyces sp. NPDC002599]|uniref:AAA family ATPase n=1 Tax=Streptomyces sp. NPDC002599 TaxID=3154421 RepID=UPI003320D029